MRNNIRELLPIGSVVLLKEGKKKVMIFGIKQTEKTTGVEHDYIGVVYPEGNLGDGLQFFFEHENIETIFHRGFEDEERGSFIEKLADYYDQIE